MKKILEVLGEPIENGGQEAFVFNVLANMDLSRARVDVFTPYHCDNTYYKSMIENSGGRIIAMELPFAPGNSRINIMKPLSEYLKNNHYDVVHVHSGSISVLAEVAFVARINHVKKIIVHSHCAAEKKTIKYGLAKLASLPIMHFCPTDYFACSQVAGDWKFSRRIAQNKLLILKNGVDLKKFAPNSEVREMYRKKLAVSGETFVIGHVGRFSYQKNHEYLIDVFEKVRSQHNDSVLLLIGEGEDFDRIQKLVHNKHLRDSVIFLGNVDNVNDYMQIMDVFLLPSHFEGLPIVGVEAQAAGLPIFVSNNVSPELKLSPTIEFLDLDDQEKWVDKTLSCLDTKHVDNSKCLLKNGYSIEDTAKKLMEVYGV
ncbi:MAG: glycosyltransferase [Eubacteriales bacterium]|nr:glycosyltransferase [Eubacteriales bacterium]